MLKKQKKLAYIEVLLATTINLILFVLKYWIGSKLDSIALKADAWHTLSDTISSIILLLGLWISSKKPDREHPFGHGRAESLTALLIGVILAFIGFQFLEESILRLRTYSSASFDTAALIIIGISVISKEGLAQFSLWAGKKLNSNSLKADGWHHRSDAISSAVVLVGAFLGSYFWWIDGILGIIVSLLLMYATYEIFKDSITTLLGEKPSQELHNKINKVVNKIDKRAKEVHHLHVHRYGDHREITFHIRLPKTMKLKDAHDIASKIEEKLKTEIAVEATIHIEPNFSNKVKKQQVTS